MQSLFLIVSRGRPESLEKTVQSIHNMTEDWFHIVVGVDEDDSRLIDYQKLCERKGFIDKLVIFEKRVYDTCLPELCNRLYAEYQKEFPTQEPDLIIPFADDIIIKTRAWDETIMRRKPMDDIYIAYPDDGFQFTCTIPMISKKVVDIVGKVAPEQLKHWYCDTWWGDIGARAHRILPMPELLFLHLTPMNPATMAQSLRDQTYLTPFMNNCKIIEEDRKVFFSEEDTKKRCQHANLIYQEVLKATKERRERLCR